MPFFVPLVVFVAKSSRDPMRGIERSKISSTDGICTVRSRMGRLNLPLAVGSDAVTNLPNHDLVSDVVVFRDELH